MYDGVVAVGLQGQGIRWDRWCPRGGFHQRPVGYPVGRRPFICCTGGQFPHQSWISLVSFITVAVVSRSLCMLHVAAPGAVPVVLPPTPVGVSRKEAPANYACNTVVASRMPAEVAWREEPCCLTPLTVDVAAYVLVFACLAGIIFVL